MEFRNKKGSLKEFKSTKKKFRLCNHANRYTEEKPYGSTIQCLMQLRMIVYLSLIKSTFVLWGVWKYSFRLCHKRPISGKQDLLSIASCGKGCWWLDSNGKDFCGKILSHFLLETRNASRFRVQYSQLIKGKRQNAPTT